MSRAIANSGITNSSHAHLAERGLQICDGLMGSGTFHCPALLAIVLRREEASRGWAGPALLPGRHCEGSRIRHLSTSMTQGALRTSACRTVFGAIWRFAQTIEKIGEAEGTASR